MRFAILGSLQATAGGRPVDITRPRWRSVLAYLLLQADRPVSIDQLTEAVWGGDPPATATTQIHAAISAIRRAFREADTAVIETTSSGYSISSGNAYIDFLAFGDGVAAARELAAADPAGAAQHLREALGLWRGPALDGINGVFVAAARQRLTEEWLTAREQLAAIDIAEGRHAHIVAELMEAAQANPLRESLTKLLMEALYRSGRKADALAVYAEARKRITTELGLEPGAELRALYLQIIQDKRDPAPLSAQAALPPRQLPPAIGSFTGREPELAHLWQVMAKPVETARARVLLLHGVGGVGKSTLAIEAAHRIAGLYPDGQLYVHGPATAAEVLMRCLRGIGQPEPAMKLSEDEAAALWRSLTAPKRLLILLDNLDDPGQAEPVIPASGQSAVIITSRGPLTLVAADAVVRVEPMPLPEAVRLIARHSKRELTPGESSMAEIASYCDHLPLALSIAGARLAAEPELTAARLAALLSDHRSRLDWLELDGVGVRSSVRAGYELLQAGDSEAHRVAVAAFHALGILPLPEADGGLVAAMTGRLRHTTGAAALDRLARAQLVIPCGGGRYRMHDTVRLVAAEIAREAMSVARQREVAGAGLAYLVACAEHAVSLLRAKRAATRPAEQAADEPVMDLSGSGLATAADVAGWLDRELPNLLAAANAAAQLPGQRHAIRLAEALSWPLHKRGQFGYENIFARNAVSCAQNLHDEAALGRALLYLGRSQLHLGQFREAARSSRRSLAIAVNAANISAQIQVLNDLGLIDLLDGRPAAAGRRFRACVKLADTTGESAWFNRVMLHNIAHVEMTAGNWEEAARLLAQSSLLRREVSDQAGIGTTLVVLGIVKVYLGRPAEAISDLTEAIAACRQTGSRLDSARGLAGLAVAHLWNGSRQSAVSVAYESLAEAAAACDPNAEAMAHRVLAAVLAETDAVEARVHAARHSSITRLRPRAPEDFAITALLDRLPFPAPP